LPPICLRESELTPICPPICLRIAACGLTPITSPESELTPTFESELTPTFSPTFSRLSRPDFLAPNLLFDDWNVEEACDYRSTIIGS